VGFADQLNHLTDEQLLDRRFCDLPLQIAGTPLEARLARLYRELEKRGLRFKPHTWLSEEWFSPDGVPGFAFPFYLAHPRLAKLERQQMLEVEGGTEKECLRIMRHETGHAIDNAFRLHGRRRYRELFGPFSLPYPDWYQPQPQSRDYVLHLPAWYAQSHPAEDFAETFAVWLTPGSRWRRSYQGWQALDKLQFVDAVMQEVAGQEPKNRSQERVEELSDLRLTLREHYQKKREHYAFHYSPDYDRQLLRIFSAEPRYRQAESAVKFLRRLRRELYSEVAEGTGVHTYAINQMIQHLMNRCRELRLRLCLSEEHTRKKLLVLLTVQTMTGMYSGYHRIAL
jgi:hypothetical protein